MSCQQKHVMHGYAQIPWNNKPCTGFVKSKLGSNEYANQVLNFGLNWFAFVTYALILYAQLKYKRVRELNSSPSSIACKNNGVVHLISNFLIQ